MDHVQWLEVFLPVLNKLFICPFNMVHFGWYEHNPITRLNVDIVRLPNHRFRSVSIEFFHSLPTFFKFWFSTVSVHSNYGMGSWWLQLIKKWTLIASLWKGGCAACPSATQMPHSYFPPLYIKDTLLPALVLNIGNGHKLWGAQSSQTEKIPWDNG